MMVSLSYEELRDKLKKGIRKGNWRKLTRTEKALYRAAMAYTRPNARIKGKTARDIVNDLIVKKLLALIKKLQETRGMRIFKRGYEKAVALLQSGEERGVFTWAPSLRSWLKDPDYIFWLGTVR
jgi:hypothetical protein